MHPNTPADTPKVIWNKGKLVGQKSPLKLKEVWSIRTRLQLAHRFRDLALLNLAIDSKLRACDLGQLEITDQARQAVLARIDKADLGFNDFLFPSRSRKGGHISTRHAPQIVWLPRL